MIIFIVYSFYRDIRVYKSYVHRFNAYFNSQELYNPNKNTKERELFLRESYP